MVFQVSEHKLMIFIIFVVDLYVKKYSEFFILIMKLNMSNKIYLLLILVILCSPALSAQEIEKMNKSDLRDFISMLNTKIDSLKSENIKYEEYFKKLSANLTQLELKSSQFETKINQVGL